MHARIAGTDLSYDVSGSGPALLLLHAFPLSLALWDDQVAAFRSRFTVVRFDCRGFGATPPGDGLLTMERIADDAAALLDHLSISRAVVCGVSMGGYAALAMVRRHADRLSGLALVDTRATADTSEARKTRAELAERVMKLGPQAALDAFLPRLMGATTHKDRPAVIDKLRAIVLANPAQGIADALFGLAARADSTETLREIRVPTLVVCGEEDTLTPPSDSLFMHERIAGSRMETVPRAGHLSNLENPSAFNAAIGAFLDSLKLPA